MKVRIEIDSNNNEDEVIIRCKDLTDDIQKIKNLIINMTNKSIISFYDNDKEYYVSLDNVLFFETDGNSIHAHTASEAYRVEYRLYELEHLLPDNFIRISKSTIVNINQIYSISYNLASSSLIDFYKSHKQVYASRYYSKDLKSKLKERTNI